MAHQRTREELENALEVQRKAIVASGKSYDEGNKWEALRLATAIYVVVHDGGRNKSILGQLGIKGSLRFIASGPPSNPNNLLRETLLVATRVYGDGTAEYIPRLDNNQHPMRPMQFHKWWERDVILRDGSFRLTRKGLVFVLRSQEGGAHFDSELKEPNYLRFAKEQLTTPYVMGPEILTPKPVLGAEIATMRQVAWELIKTLEEYGTI